MHQIFRRIHLVALATGTAVIQTPGASGDNVQYMPAAQADALVAAELADKLLKPEERQKQFYKNGIASIDAADYYAHDVKQANGAWVTEYRLTPPEPAAPKNPAPVQFDPNQMAHAMGQAFAQAMQQMGQNQAQYSQPVIDEPQQPAAAQAAKPDPHAPQADALLAQQNQDGANVDRALGTTAANIRAVNSLEGATNPAAPLLSAQQGGNATDAGNPAADQTGQQDGQQDAGKPADQAGQQGTNQGQQDVQKPAGKPAPGEVPSGRPGGRKAAQKAPAQS